VAFARESEPDTEEMRLAQGNLVRALDPLARGESALIDEPTVDPDEPSQLDVLRVVCAEDRRSVVAVPEDDLDLIGRPGVCERREGEREHEQHRNYQ
jgi:hypothetical protein